jgi:branched-chain amino acid transport system ATP-binding protein
MSSKSALLETDSLTKRYGRFVAVSDLSISFYDNEICAIIGPNGAGKTTLFNLITGGTSSSDGRVIFNGTDITDLDPHEIAREGLIRSFQITNVFEDLTVSENLQVALLSNRTQFDVWNKISGTNRPPNWDTGTSGCSNSPLHSERSPICCCLTNHPVE